VLVETSLREVPLAEVPRAAGLAEALGFDGLTASEVKQDPFLAVTLMATASRRLRLTTSVAIAFPRSPMIVAYLANDLRELSRGRFALGLGTQVKGHIERRFSTPWTAPGPRLREYVLALRAIWECWQRGTPLNFQGEHYSFTLMTPWASPGPSRNDPIPIHLAAVNTYNIQLAAELADGLRVHSFCTPAYIREVIRPNLLLGAERAGRSPTACAILGGGFIATGPDEAAVRVAREKARRRIAFYASTRTYLPVLEHHGWGDLNPRLRALIAENRWDEFASLVTDEVLDTFCTSGTYATIAQWLAQRLGGLVDSITLPFPDDLAADRDGLSQALPELKLIPSARPG